MAPPKHGDATKIVIDVLDAALSVPVHAKIPESRPVSFVTVRRTGGPLRNMVVDDAQMTVSSWAASDFAAQDLAQTVRQALHAATETPGNGVIKITEFSGPYVDDDEMPSRHARYSQTFSVSIRATVS